MKRILLVVFFICFSILLVPAPAQAAEQVISRSDSISTGSEDGVLCLPGVYFHDMGDCAPVGPSTYLTEMAEMGITLPLTPLPAKKPDFELTYVDVRYGQVRTSNAPVYPSVESALKGNRKQAIRRIDAPFSYISYTDEVVIDGKRFYMIEPNAWMTANDVIRIGAVPLFQGMTLDRTPDHAFGWVLSYLSSGPVETKRTPGYQHDDYTGHILNNHEVVPVFSEKQVGDTTWYLIAPDEWLPEKVVARVIPNITPPEGVTGDRWIEVNLYEQTVAVYDQRELVFATLVASGLEPFWTQPGVFQIYDKYDSAPMRGSFEADRSDAYYLEDVPWTMYFDQARALHGAYWRANLGFPQSHGCVNLSVGDSRWLFDWADVGDWVYVWDPSGRTPDDPNYYTAGGA